MLVGVKLPWSNSESLDLPNLDEGTALHEDSEGNSFLDRNLQVLQGVQWLLIASDFG